MQRDLQHWIPLLNHFDAYLTKHLSSQPEEAVDKVTCLGQTSDFPQRNVLGILRVTQQVVKHCVNKQTYNSVEVRSFDVRHLPGVFVSSAVS